MCETLTYSGDSVPMYHQIIETALCVLDALAVPGYGSMTAVCCLATVVPALKEMASHGKTRQETTTTIRTTTTTQPATARRGGFRSLMVPKKLFRHFYVWGLVFLTLTLVVARRRNQRQQQQQQDLPSTSTSLPSCWLPSPTATLLLYLHLARRLYECCHVHQWRRGSEMHALGYLVGALHYVWLPLVFVRCADCGRRMLDALDDGSDDLSSIINALLHAQYDNLGAEITSRHEQTSTSTDDAGFSTITWLTYRLSILLCLSGQYQQHRHHVLLAKLRRVKPKDDDDSKSTSSKYSLPTGGWFRYVFCPHYLAEILIYISFALLLWHESVPGHRHWVVLAWVASNLTLGARINLHWYRKNLPLDAVKGRTAIIPFLF